MCGRTLSCVVGCPVMLRFDAYGFLHLLVINHLLLLLLYERHGVFLSCVM